MAANLLATPAEVLYDRDFIAWTEEMARLIENHQTEGLDWGNLAEEIRDLGNSRKSAATSHLENLMMHLIRWEIQPALRSRSWRNSISNARREIDVLLDTVPGLNRHFNATFERSYGRAHRDALRETHLPSGTPYTKWTREQVLDLGFLPE